MSLLARIALMAVAVGIGAGCSKAQARTPPPAPVKPTPMVTPEPPYRLIIPQSLPPAPPAETTPSQAPREPQRAPAKPTEKPPVPPPATPPSTVDPPVVQTNQNGGALEDQARRQLASANTNLATVKYEALSASARATYDDLRRLIRVAEQNLRIKNFVFAAELADKAALLASLLVKGEV